MSAARIFESVRRWGSRAKNSRIWASWASPLNSPWGVDAGQWRFALDEMSQCAGRLTPAYRCTPIRTVNDVSPPFTTVSPCATNALCSPASPPGPSIAPPSRTCTPCPVTRRYANCP